MELVPLLALLLVVLIIYLLANGYVPFLADDSSAPDAPPAVGNRSIKKKITHRKR